MKSIPNKSTTITKQEPGKDNSFCTYADLIKVVCDQPARNPDGRYKISDISMRLAIRKACDEAEGKETIELEDNRMSYLKAITETSSWDFIHNDLVEFSETIKSIK